MQDCNKNKSDNRIIVLNKLIIETLNQAGHDNQSIARAIGTDSDIIQSLYAGKNKKPSADICARLIRFYYHCFFSGLKDKKAPASKRKYYKPVPSQQRKSYYLGEPYDSVYFTQRELDCVGHMLQGRTIPATANLLGLSPRTVEFYVNNMKIKIGVRNKRELVQKILKSKLIRYIDL